MAAPVSFSLWLDTLHVLTKRADKQPDLLASFEHLRAYAVCCTQNVTARREFWESLGKPWHEVLQLRIALIILANEPTWHRIRADPEPLRMLFCPQAGALNWVATRQGIGSIEGDGPAIGTNRS